MNRHRQTQHFILNKKSFAVKYIVKGREKNMCNSNESLRNKFYFTFGTYDGFPYTRGQYLIVIAENLKQAALKFKEKYPNPLDDTVLNCADYYTE